MSGDRLDLDVLIVGGGMVGATLALALSRQTDFRIGLMESRPPADLPQQGFDLRVSAITRASERIFRHLDVWESMLSMRVSPYSRMRVWQEGEAVSDSTRNPWVSRIWGISWRIGSSFMPCGRH